MDIERMISEFTRATKAREAKWSQEHDTVKKSRASNSACTSAHLRSVVEPLLSVACAAVQRLGYSAAVEARNVTDTMYAGGKEILTLELRVESKFKKILPKTSPSLTYQASFNDLRIGVIRRTDNSDRDQAHYIPITELSKATVDAQIEGFLESVFRPPLLTDKD